MTSPRTISVIPPLDGLRGVAALLVLGHHFFKSFPISGTGIWSTLQHLTSFGQTGVDLFFVLSGFLITRILLASRDRADYFSSFYIRRALRIFPLYFLGLALYYLVVIPLKQESIPPFNLQWWYWCYFQNVGITFQSTNIEGPAHFWSLAVEEHFYLIWPVIIYLVPRQRVALVCYVMIAVALLSRAVMLNDGYGYLVLYFTPCRLDALAVGALLAVWERDGRLTAFSKSFIILASALIIVMVIMMISLSNQSSNIAQWSKYLIYALFYGCIIGLIRNNSTRTIPLLSTGFLRWTGKISYGLYVYHLFVIEVVAARLDQTQFSRIFLFIICIGTSYLLAWASYTFYESWFLQLKNKVTIRTVESRAAQAK